MAVFPLKDLNSRTKVSERRTEAREMVAELMETIGTLGNVVAFVASNVPLVEGINTAIQIILPIVVKSISSPPDEPLTMKSVVTEIDRTILAERLQDIPAELKAIRDALETLMAGNRNKSPDHQAASLGKIISNLPIIGKLVVGESLPPASIAKDQAAASLEYALRRGQVLLEYFNNKAGILRKYPMHTIKYLAEVTTILWAVSQLYYALYPDEKAKEKLLSLMQSVINSTVQEFWEESCKCIRVHGGEKTLLVKFFHQRPSLYGSTTYDNNYEWEVDVREVNVEEQSEVIVQDDTWEGGPYRRGTVWKKENATFQVHPAVKPETYTVGDPEKTKDFVLYSPPWTGYQDALKAEYRKIFNDIFPVRPNDF